MKGVMTLKRKEPKYYDIAHLPEEYPDALYYIVYGERSNGKTYSMFDYCIRKYFNHGEEFAYIRRWGEDIRPKRLSTAFDEHVKHGRISTLSHGLFDAVNYTSGKFFPSKFDEDRGKLIMPERPIGHAFDLNSMEHYKSISFPYITTIVFEEFLSRNGYLPNEFILFMNSLSTIIRNRRNVKIFMIGNTINQYCPYFNEMGLKHVKDQKPGTVDVYTYPNNGLKVVVEYTDPMSNRGGKESDIYFAFDNPQLKMITNGAWEIASYPHIDTHIKTRDVIWNFFICFDGEILHGKVITTENDIFLYFHPKTGEIKYEEADIIYGDKPDTRWNWRVGIFNQSDNLSRLISKLMRENRVFYSDNESGEMLRNYLSWCETYNVTRGS